MQAIEADRATRIDVEAFHAGHETVIRAIYVEHGAALLRESRRYAGPAEAESVVHDVFVELLRNRALRAQFVGGALAAWLRQIARLKALEHLRRDPSTASAGVEPGGALGRRESGGARRAHAVPGRRQVPDAQKKILWDALLGPTDAGRDRRPAWNSALDARRVGAPSDREAARVRRGDVSVIHALHVRQIDRYFAGTLRPSAAIRMFGRLWRCGACRLRYERHLLHERTLPDGDARAAGAPVAIDPRFRAAEAAVSATSPTAAAGRPTAPAVGSAVDARRSRRARGCAALGGRRRPPQDGVRARRAGHDRGEEVGPRPTCISSERSATTRRSW